MSQRITGIELTEIATISPESVQSRVGRSCESPALNRDQFRKHGIATATGRLSATEASIQVLMLPVLILFWGVAVAIIAAVV